MRLRLRDVVQKKFGDGYEVEDISAHRYARDLKFSPFEYAIIVCVWKRRVLCSRYFAHAISRTPNDLRV